MFAVGQEIECINDDWGPSKQARLFPSSVLFPKKGDVVHCGGYVNPSELPYPGNINWIRLQESHSQSAYAAHHFRAVVKRTTSIEVFEKLLVPSKKKLETV